MASSKKPFPNKTTCSTHDNHLINHLEEFLAPLVQPRQTLLAAFSGGLDSRALLELLVLLRLPLGFELRAMHVHHGLSPNADQWADFCARICILLDVPLDIVHVQVPLDSGRGKEAAARELRYQALRQAGADYIVLAHQEDDQAETLLLQLLRGAGAKGLAAMAKYDAQKRYLRPLLDVPRNALLAFARQRELKWIEDESNSDTSYDRNYCRHEILPLMERRFPAARQALARSAAHLAESAELLDELAGMDAEGRLSDGQLDVTALQQLSPPRARNLLRWWLSRQQLIMPSTQRLEEMLRQLTSARADAGVKVAVGKGAWLRRYRNLAYVESGGPTQPISLVWQGEAELLLPDKSRLVFEKTSGQGLAFKYLGSGKLRITYRQGGERFRPDAARPTRTLKHLLQETNMPPWQREHLPLVYCEDKLAVVPGIGITAEMQAMGNEPGLVITWQQR